jgi:hypothetical protein
MSEPKVCIELAYPPIMYFQIIVVTG